MEDHNNEKRPRQQGRSNYTRRAPRANNNNQNRKPGAPAPAAQAPRRQRRKNHSPSTASRSAAVPRSPSRLQRAMR